MNKSELVNAVSTQAELSKKDAAKAVDALLESISSALANEEKIQLVGFGTFEVRERAARTGRNPQTGQEIQITASRFLPSNPERNLRKQ
jgi:DNA-binding protein HU-beta